MRFRGGEQSLGIPQAHTAEQSALPRRKTEALSEPMKKRANEVETVATNILHGEMHALHNKDRNGASATVEQIESDPALNLYSRLDYISNIQETPQGQEVNVDLVPTPRDVLQNKIQVEMEDGTLWTVKSIDARHGDSFACTIDDGSGTIEQLTIPRSQLLQEQLLAEQAVVRESMKTKYGEESAEYKLVDSYLESIGGATETALDKAEPDEVNRLLTEAAKKRNIFTVDDAKAFIDRNYPELPKAPEGTSINLSNEQIQKLHERDTLLAQLEGKNILDYDTFKSVLGKDLPEELTQTTQRVSELKQRLQSASKDERAAIQEQLISAQTQELVLKSAQQYIEAGGAMEQFFNGVQTGAISTEEARTAINTFRSGDIDATVDAFIKTQAEANNSVLSEKHRQEVRAAFMKKGKISIAVLVALLAAGGMMGKGMQEE